MENVYVVFDSDDFVIGVYRTLESARKCALEEIEDFCDRNNFDELEKSKLISDLNYMIKAYKLNS